MMLASAGLASANRGLTMNEAARLSRQGGQLVPTSTSFPVVVRPASTALLTGSWVKRPTPKRASVYIDTRNHQALGKRRSSRLLVYRSLLSS